MSVILLGIFDSAIAVTKETTGLTKSIRMGLYFKNKMTLKILFPLKASSTTFPIVQFV